MGLGFLFPTVFSLIGFILAIVGLFAGNTPGFMENYQVILLNTSTLGLNYVPALTTNTNSARDVKGVEPISAHVSLIGDKLANVTINSTAADGAVTVSVLMPRQLTLAAAEGVLAGLTYDQAAVQMAAVLGISQFYSLHVMNVCEGAWSPNASAVGAWRNVSQCTAQLSASQLNISKLIDQEMANQFTGDASLALLGVSSSLQAALNRIPTIGLVLAVFFIVGCICAGLAVLLPLVALVTAAAKPRETVLANLGAASGASLALLVAALVAQVAAAAAVETINRLGAKTIGMQAVQGTSFANLTWAAFAMMLISTGYWCRELYASSKPAAPPPKKEAPKE